MDPLLLIQMEFYEKYINAQISLYVSLHYILELNGIKQALVILQNCTYQIEDALEFKHNNGLKGAHKSDKIESIAQELKDETLKKVQYAQCKCQAKYLMQVYNSSR
jgi:hypothetical protein